MVIVLRDLAHALQRVLYELPDEQRLSALASLPLHLALMPAAGGMILGIATLFLRRRKSRYVDLVEANALHGGRLSMVDSLIITAQTVVSNGFGASVGLEAAYTQMGGGVASKLGDVFQLRRADMRKLVGCGAAGAIAAAFGAPLTGAFYAFELIIGTYTIAGLAPVVAASIAAVLVASLFGKGVPIVSITQAIDIGLPQVVLIVLCGFATGGIGILLMRLVGLIEAAFSGLKIPTWVRPAIGRSDAAAVGDVLADAAVLEAGRVAYNPHYGLGEGDRFVVLGDASVRHTHSSVRVIAEAAEQQLPIFCTLSADDPRPDALAGADLELQLPPMTPEMLSLLFEAAHDEVPAGVLSFSFAEKLRTKPRGACSPRPAGSRVLVRAAANREPAEAGIEDPNHPAQRPGGVWLGQDVGTRTGAGPGALATGASQLGRG